MSEKISLDSSESEFTVKVPETLFFCRAGGVFRAGSLVIR